MNLKLTHNISIRIILIFLVAICVSLLADNIHELLGDTYCKTGSGRFVWQPNLNSYYEYCSYSGQHIPTWHWGYRHWLLLFMGICLSIVQIVDIIITIVEHYESQTGKH